MKPFYLVCMLLCLANLVFSQAATDKKENLVANAIASEPLPKGARLYVAPIQNGFETYIIAGLEKKKVPVVVVADRSKADYELTGVSESDRAGWAKMLFLGSQVCPDFCVNDQVLFLGMGSGEGVQFPFPSPSL
jgi:hypothetical protein